MKLIIGVLLLTVACTNTGTAPPKDVVLNVITQGETPNWQEHLVAEKVVVFDVYADWCGPCKQLEKSLLNLLRTYPQKLVVKKCDLVAWDSELAKTNGISDLPYLIVYDQSGNLFAKGPSNQVMPKLVKLLNGKLNHG